MKTLDEILKQAENEHKNFTCSGKFPVTWSWLDNKLQQAFSAGQEAKFSSTYKSSERYLTAWKLGREEMKKEIIKSLPETKQRVLDKKHGALREEYEHYKTGWNDCRGKMLNNLEKL